MYTAKQYYPAKALSSVIDEFFNGLPASKQNVTVSKVPVNIHEDANGYHLELIVPGRAKEDFTIKLDQNLLTISAEKKETAEKDKDYITIRREFSIPSFSRTFTIDNKINAEGIEAKYENGILLVFLPKKEEVKNLPKQIAIS